MNNEKFDSDGLLKIEYNDSLAERVRKMSLLKKQSSTEREGSKERCVLIFKFFEE